MTRSGACKSCRENEWLDWLISKIVAFQSQKAKNKMARAIFSVSLNEVEPKEAIKRTDSASRIEILDCMRGFAAAVFLSSISGGFLILTASWSRLFHPLFLNACFDGKAEVEFFFFLRVFVLPPPYLKAATATASPR